MASNQEQPCYLHEQIFEGADFHRFFKGKNWENDCPPNFHEILKLMKEGSAFSMVSVNNGQTTLIGPTEGTANPVDLAKNIAGPAVATNAGFFLHWNFFFLEHDKGPLMREGKYGYLIGESSLGRAHVDFSDAYADLMQIREFTDGTFLTVGPSLNKPLRLPQPSFKEQNTDKGAFTYFATDETGKKMESVVYHLRKEWDSRFQDALELQKANLGPSMETEKQYLIDTIGQKIARDESGNIVFASAAPSNEWIRCKWHRVPGGLSHANEPNERAGNSVHPNGQVVHYAYNSKRSSGVTLNEFRLLLIEGCKFLGLDFDEIEPGKIWANDGGPSVVQLFVKDSNGTIRALAVGGRDVQSWPINLEDVSFRNVPNMIVIKGAL